MTTITVSDFANELKRPADALLEQLQAAGVAKKSVSDALTDSDKQQLLNYLQASHGTGATRKKITLTKKTTSEIKQADATGKARTIQVAVRKKRTFIKRDEDAAPAPAPAVAPAAPAPAPAP
ncbi:MAG TPA: translation initiation factor IF-2 associated domain-containing protein, partial [Piscinibacter sp.]|nr:translation initiation factor IF-2 associated domain-containing protein [Piscinibacter sp.]